MVILPSGSPEVTTKVESYDGSSWSEGPDINVARYGAQSDGPQTAALIAGGIAPGSPEFLGNSESWNGSSWTTTPALNTARGYIGHAGTSTASIVFAGRAQDLAPQTQVKVGMVLLGLQVQI